MTTTRNDSILLIAQGLLFSDAFPVKYETDECKECGGYPSDGMDEDDIVDTGIQWIDGHGMLGSRVIIGCEGYLQVSPESLMMTDRPNWDDWTE